MRKSNRGSLRAAVWLLGLALTSIAFAQSPPGPPDNVVNFVISQNRGADNSVNYGELTKFGPWDDRNYKLKKKDLELLSPNEAEAIVPIPAFYRVQMRRANPSLPTSGPAQYPRSALNGFLAEYGGYQINNTNYRGLRALGGNRYEVLESSSSSDVSPNFLSGTEKRVTTPAGAAESAVAVNPVNTNLAIAGTNGPGSGQKMWRSTDGGATWLGPVSLANTCCDPTVGWSPDGTIGYAGALSTVVGGGTNVLFYRSSDNGASWNLAKTLSTLNQSDKEYLHVDMHATSPRKGNIYMAWHNSNVQKFARSTDTGVTWGSVLTLDSASRGIGSDITSDKNGNAYFFVPTTSGGSNAKKIRVLKSTDGGATFAAGVNVASTNADFDFPIPSFETRRAFVYVSADVDRSGGAFGNSIYVSWTDTTTLEDDNVAANNHATIKVAFSRDGGATWTVRTPHPTADAATVDRFNQWLSVDQNGRIFVAYYDTRHSTSRTGTDMYFSMSSDGGQTWTAGTRLTSVTSKNITDSFEWGDYNGMDMVLKDIIAIYTDNRNETGGTAQSVDVYVKGGFAPTGGNVAPVSNFSFTTSGLTANFTDSSTDSDGTIASRSWNFGDGTTSTATNPSKTYATAGTRNVTLTVTDNLGATNAVTKAVTVSAPPNTLTNGVPRTGLAAATGAELRFTMAVPAGATNLKFELSGGTGDADLYVKFNAAPTTAVFDCRPFLSGNTETCTFATPSVGTYHVMVRAFAAFSGVTLKGSYTITTPGAFFENANNFTINDNVTVESSIAVTGVAGNAPATLKVGVDIKHTFIGDLKVDLVAPDGSVYVLHNRTGSGTDNILTTFTVNASTEVANGTWKLRVNDNANADTGFIDKWSLQF